MRDDKECLDVLDMPRRVSSPFGWLCDIFLKHRTEKELAKLRENKFTGSVIIHFNNGKVEILEQRKRFK